MKKPRAVSDIPFWKTRLIPGLVVVATMPLILSSCGRKEEPKPAAVTVPAKAPASADLAPLEPAAKTPPPANEPGLKSIPAPPPSVQKTASPVGTRNPDDAVAWQRWDRASAKLSDIGVTTRPSNEPHRMEIVVSGDRMGPAEARAIVKNVHQSLGNAASVTLYNQSGIPLAEASASGIR